MGDKGSADEHRLSRCLGPQCASCLSCFHHCRCPGDFMPRITGSMSTGWVRALLINYHNVKVEAQKGT